MSDTIQDYISKIAEDKYTYQANILEGEKSIPIDSQFDYEAAEHFSAGASAMIPVTEGFANELLTHFYTQEDGIGDWKWKPDGIASIKYNITEDHLYTTKELFKLYISTLNPSMNPSTTIQNQELIDKIRIEAAEKYPTKNDDVIHVAVIGSMREAYKAGRLKSIEEKDKEIAKLKDAIKSRNILQEEDRERIKELEDGLLSSLGVLTSIREDLKIESLGKIFVENEISYIKKSLNLK